MHKTRTGSLAPWVIVLCACVMSVAQVVAPEEIKDPELRSLQSRYLNELKAIGKEINNTAFDYPFYLSRRLDLDQQQQKNADQHSVRFERYNGKIVLAVSGNYYAAYSAEHLNMNERARRTFVHVAEPILKHAVSEFQDNKGIEGYAVEVSHHVLTKVMGVPMERPENLMVFLSQDAALKLVASTDENTQQAALLQGQIFVNAQPLTLWLNGDGPQLASTPLPETPAESKESSQSEIEIGGGSAGHPAANCPKRPTPADDPPHPQPLVRDNSPAALASLQAAYDPALTAMLKQLEPQAHFVSYAAPRFIVFRQSIYLELSLNTVVAGTGAASRYKLAALAFDDHIAHLIRPVLAYFKEDPAKKDDFDGVGFSASIHTAGKGQPSQGSEAVEFFFPFPALRCYEKYDCTGQQLIDSGTILINGERIALDLQVAEGSAF